MTDQLDLDAIRARLWPRSAPWLTHWNPASTQPPPTAAPCMTRTAVMAMSEQVTAAAELVSGEAAALLASVEAAKKRREEAGR